ncbi:MAG: GHMP kinase [Proteobacteria bacterium]|nr:MAG: GHMP kinase [Pseudomonadota bacterium]
MTNASTSTAGLPEAGAHAPGKLILSGEHSVLYGSPALAMAIARYTEVWFTPMSPSEGLKTAFSNLSSGARYSLQLLSRFKSKMDGRFDQFVRGELDVHKILTHPDDLAVYTLSSLLQDKPQDTTAMPGIGALNQLPIPGELGSRSDLPIGAGMGSSAAIVAATTVLFENMLNRPKTLEERHERVCFCERLKHGKAGPIDAASVVWGGLVRVRDGLIDTPSIAPNHGLISGKGWYWVLHGRPDCSTGECVSKVRQLHEHDTPLWDSFTACTHAIEQALQQGDDPSTAITENQRLLEHIGVVPTTTQAFIRDIEAIGGAAKICGAGAIRGDAGGAILVHLNDPDAMSILMAKHPELSWSPLQLSLTGAASGPAPSTKTPNPEAQR